MENSNARTFFIGGGERNSLYHFSSNYISTTKYTLATYLPKSLFEQFRRVVNIYFLITAVLQSIPEISPLHPFSAIAPLVFVLAVSMIREGVEDFLRYRSDKQTNSAETYVYKQGQFLPVASKDVVVGDLVMVHNNAAFPCDLVLLSSAHENGLCYIETSSLDGEKTLKPRMVFPPTKDLFKTSKIIRIFAALECELPNARLYQFSGSVNVDGTKRPLDKEQLLLAGAKLRSTRWVIGAAVYTGNDSKLRQNSTSRQFKQSGIERNVNRFIYLIVAVQFFLCLYCAANAGVWTEENMDNHWYLGESSYSGSERGYLNFFTYFLLLNTMLPISLIISLEIAKVAQGLFMQFDKEMYSQVRDQPCKVSTFSLNEELGMIDYVFTDKTGTLTCNRMEFKYCTIGQKSYGAPSKDLDSSEGFCTDELISDLGLQTAQGQRCDLFVKCMALCHECLIETETQNTPQFTGQSPDEVAIVTTAKLLGYEYLGIDNGFIDLALEDKQKLIRYERICVLEFDSDRKRSSVIVQEVNSKEIYIFTKGADNVINPLLSPQNDRDILEDVRQNLHRYSGKGLRTLMLAYAQIPAETFKKWRDRYEQALQSTSGRQEGINALALEVENNLTLLGCTAVEDALQDEVPSTIRDLHVAGIHIWMLTGDKLETAENIGKTCSLIQDGMLVAKCTGTELNDCYSSLVRIKACFENNKQYKTFGLIIEGSAIEYVMLDSASQADTLKFPELQQDAFRHLTRLTKRIFLELASVCTTVICCRMTPGQKQGIVRFVKQNFGATTLSIGDGANDVSMILEAHVGVGLYGEEGMQSVQASDYAIGEFKYLWELLLVHGRLNYIRQSEMIMYFFYKNLVFTIPQFFFAFYCAFSGQTVYDDWYISFYNMVFTALPLLVRAVFDADIIVPSRNTLPAFSHERDLVPKTYVVGRKNQIFTLTNLIVWLGNGTLHAAIVYFILLHAADEGYLNIESQNHDLWSFSITSFSAVILIVNLKLALATRLWHFLHFVAILGLSIIPFFGFILVYDYITPTDSGNSLLTLMDSYYYWMSLYLCVCLVLSMDGGMHLWRRITEKTLAESILEVVKAPLKKELNHTCIEKKGDLTPLASKL